MLLIRVFMSEKMCTQLARVSFIFKKCSFNSPSCALYQSYMSVLSIRKIGFTFH